MKFRYYLRGAGVGIIVSTIILMIIFNQYKPTMSSEEIKKEAEKLGMVMKDESSKEDEFIQQEGDNQQGDTTEGENNEQSEDEGGTPSDGTGCEQPEDEGSKNPDETASEEGQNQTGHESGQTVVLVIERGDTSSVVSEKLEALGLVEDAEDFDHWLCVTLGKGENIYCGTFEIAMGATYEEIAEKILFD